MKELSQETQAIIDFYRPQGFEFVTFLYPDEPGYYLPEERQRVEADYEHYRIVRTNRSRREEILYRKPGKIESAVRYVFTHVRRRS